jgi:hypothetical protein
MQHCTFIVGQMAPKSLSVTVCYDLGKVFHTESEERQPAGLSGCRKHVRFCGAGPSAVQGSVIR